MRISPINASLYVQQKNYSNNSRNLRTVTPDTTVNPSFKSTPGKLLSFGAGTLGLVMTVLSGGSTAWAIPLFGGLGYVGGEAAKPSEQSAPQYDPSAYEPLSGCEWI